MRLDFENIKWGVGTLLVMGAVATEGLLQRATEQWTTFLNSDSNSESDYTQKQVAMGMLAGAVLIAGGVKYYLSHTKGEEDNLDGPRMGLIVTAAYKVAPVVLEVIHERL